MSAEGWQNQLQHDEKREILLACVIPRSVRRLLRLSENLDCLIWFADWVNSLNARRRLTLSSKYTLIFDIKMQVLTKERKEQFKRFEKNVEWFQSHYEDLKKQYKDEYVAIDNQRVLGHNSDIEQLTEEMRREHRDLGAFVIEYLTDKKLQLIL